MKHANHTYSINTQENNYTHSKTTQQKVVAAVFKIINNQCSRHPRDLKADFHSTVLAAVVEILRFLHLPCYYSIYNTIVCGDKDLFTIPLLFRVKDKAALTYTETTAATAGVATAILGSFPF